MRSRTLLSLAFSATVCLLTQAAEAAISYHVTVNTAPLAGNPDAPFALDFQLTGGNSLSNTATLSNFTFSLGGAATNNPAATPYAGNVTGDLFSSVTLTNGSSSFFNEFYQGFTPGSTLGFDLTLTANVNGPSPDGFSFAILDNQLFNIQTNGLGDSLLLIDLNSTAPTPQIFSSLNGVTLTLAPIPEPSGFVFGGGVLGLAGFIRRRRTLVTA